MPLEVSVCIVSDEIKLPNIGPTNPPATMSDRAAKQVIMLSCNKDDDGGVVSVFDADKANLISLGEYRLVLENEKEEEFFIEEGGTFEREIGINLRGVQTTGSLVVKHVV